MNLQWLQFPNLLILNNSRQVDMQLKSINLKIKGSKFDLYMNIYYYNT